jgi:hypothetical protein
MPKRKLPPNEEIIGMYESGMSSGEIAKKYNVKPVTVVSLLHRIGYKLRTSQESNAILESRGARFHTAFWLGKTQPPEMVEKRVSKIRGENHWLWKGGNARRNYRDNIVKEICAKCGSKLNLGIHHIDFDHYHDEDDNLQVLCVSCHISVHKQAYWDAIHGGYEPPKSNSPIGWDRKPEEGGGNCQK